MDKVKCGVQVPRTGDTKEHRHAEILTQWNEDTAEHGNCPVKYKPWNIGNMK